MRLKIILSSLSLLFLFSATSLYADARLEQELGLSQDQAAKVNTIQSKYRQEYSKVRQEYNRENRALRRARLDGDNATVAGKEKTTKKLEQDMKAIKSKEDGEIKALLNAEQKAKFEAWVQKREARDRKSGSRDIR
ncbi:MAG: Spy/CpxP family protein refolding chaperone [Deltaproteobacteria bacterium]|nr:Spy/CpxP family protein refolding chaperone [Deltaproteobacteria bacterium]